MSRVDNMNDVKDIEDIEDIDYVEDIDNANNVEDINNVDSEFFTLYYQNNSKELIQQAIIKRRELGIGVAIVNINIVKEITYICINNIPPAMNSLRELIINDPKKDISLYFMLCNQNNSQLFVHELV